VAGRHWCGRVIFSLNLFSIAHSISPSALARAALARNNVQHKTNRETRGVAAAEKRRFKKL
jgi:hypothetical protein